MITFNGASTGTGNGAIAYTVSPNPAAASRAAVLQVAATASNATGSINFNVTQLAGP